MSKDALITGQRLAIARKLKGFTQENILDEEIFPKVNVKTLRRWEKEGVNLTRLEEVARFFGTEVWAFTESRITVDEFKNLISYPNLIDSLKARFAIQNGLSNRNPSPVTSTSENLEKTYQNACFLIASGQFGPFKQIIEDGFPVNYQNEMGWTLLMWAGHKGRLHFAKYLVEQGADLEISDLEGLTATICAAAREHVETLSFLLDEGAIVNRTDHTGWSALCWAAADNRLTSLELLLRYGADPNLMDEGGELPLHRAIKSVAKGVLAKLLDETNWIPVDLNLANGFHETPLELAKGNKVLEKKLLSLGALHRQEVRPW